MQQPTQLALPRDQLKDGFKSGDHSTLLHKEHPVKLLEEKHAKQSEQLKLDTYAKIYGTHYPMRVQLEQYTLQRNGGGETRLGGLPSVSNSIIRDALTGNDTTLGFGDLLNDAHESYYIQPDFHYAQEAKLGIDKSIRF